MSMGQSWYDYEWYKSFLINGINIKANKIPQNMKKYMILSGVDFDLSVLLITLVNVWCMDMT